MRSGGIVQMAASKSTSVHSAPRISPGRTKVRASNWRPYRTSGVPLCPSIARNKPPSPLGSIIAARCRTIGAVKRPSERRRRVAYRSSCGDRIAKDRADSRTQPPRALPPPVRFDAAKHLQNFGSRDLCDRPRSEGGVGHADKPFQLADRRVGPTLRAALGDKFGRNYAEGVGLLVGLRELSTREEIGESKSRRVLEGTALGGFGDSRRAWGAVESGDESPPRRDPSHPETVHGYAVGSRRTRAAAFRGGRGARLRT